MNLTLIAAAGAAALIVAAGLIATEAGGAGAPPHVGAAQYDSQSRLQLPADYRRWTFLTAGSDMSYAVSAPSGGHVFDNVFASPEAVAGFEKAGVWPDGTVLIIEVRGGATKGSINKAGVFQSGEPLAWEAHVKDAARFAGGWGFFHFNAGDHAAALIPQTAGCYSCHQAHAAADTTFVQFYPTLLPVAQAKGTISDAYRREEAAAHP